VVVRAYCESGADANEESLGRHSSEALRPLALAAMGGHSGVVKILLEHGADVHSVRAMHFLSLRSTVSNK
jgi:ankyrin repeat protein